MKDPSIARINAVDAALRRVLSWILFALGAIFAFPAVLAAALVLAGRSPRPPGAVAIFGLIAAMTFGIGCLVRSGLASPRRPRPTVPIEAVVRRVLAAALFLLAMCLVRAGIAGFPAGARAMDGKGAPFAEAYPLVAFLIAAAVAWLGLRLWGGPGLVTPRPPSKRTPASKGHSRAFDDFE